MKSIKNLRAGVLVIPDADLKLRSGETVEVAGLTPQMNGLLQSGHLALPGEKPAKASPATEPDLSKMNAQEAIETIAEIDDPEELKSCMEKEKRRSVLDALNKKRQEVKGGAD